MGDMKTPDFDDLLAAFDIPDATSLDAKEAIQTSHDEAEGHLRPAGMCIGDDISAHHAVHALDVPAVSVIVKNTSRQESFEAAAEEEAARQSQLVQNGFRCTGVAVAATALDYHHESQGSYSKLEASFLNGDNSRSPLDMTAHRPDRMLSFSQFSPISSPEPEDTQGNGIEVRPKDERPYFPAASSLFEPVEFSMLDNQRKLLAYSMFDNCHKRDIVNEPANSLEQQAGPEQSRTDEHSEGLNKDYAKRLGILGSPALSPDNLHSMNLEETSSFSLSESGMGTSHQCVRTPASKLSSCLAALVALNAKKDVESSKEKQTNSRDPPAAVKEAPKAGTMVPKSPKSPRSPLEVVKRLIKQPDSPMSVCSDSSGKASPSVTTGSPPAIPRVRIKTIKTSSGQIKRTVTSLLPDSELEDLLSPADSTASHYVVSAEESSPSPLPRPPSQNLVGDSVLENGRNKPSPKTTPAVMVTMPAILPPKVTHARAEGSFKKKARGQLSTSFQNASSALMRAVNVVQQQQQYRQQKAASIQVANAPNTNLLPKAVHLANLNLVPHSVAASVAARSTTPRQSQPQLTNPMVYSTVPLVHQVKKAAPLPCTALPSPAVGTLNRLLNATNPVPTYVPNLNPPPESDISLPVRGYRCLECGDSFGLERSLAQHYGRRSVHIEVACMHCSKTMVFLNKCSLLAHAREHKSQGVVMQCTQLFMKPIPTDQMFIPPLSSSAVAATASRVTPSASGSPVPAPASSTKVKPVMPLYPDKIIRHGLKCLECNKQLADYRSLAGHYQRVSEETEGLTCRLCTMMLPNKCSYRAHQRLHAHKSQYCCPECGAVSRSVDIQKHVKENCLHYARKIGYKCLHCDLFYMSTNMHKRHIEEKHCEIFYKCSLCPVAFKSADGCLMHIKTKHNATTMSPQLIYKCACETFFKQKQLLFQHFHQNAKKHCVFKCPECAVVFTQKQALMQHFKGVHEGVFRAAADAESAKHVEEVSTPHQDATSHPTRQAKVNSSVRHTAAASQGDGPAALKSNSKLNLKNTGWTCGECLHWLPDRETYVSHMKTSHGKSVKRYPCQQCERSFNSSTSLRRHLRNDHMGKRKVFTCWYCTDEKMTFTKHFMLKNHISLMHGIKNPDFSQMTNPAPQGPSQGSRERPGAKRRGEETLREGVGGAAPEATPAKRLRPQFRCAKCGFTTEDGKTFQQHISQHKADDATPQCPHCGLCFASQLALNRHLFIVHKVKQLEEQKQQQQQEEEEDEDEDEEANEQEKGEGPRSAPIGEKVDSVPPIGQTSSTTAEWGMRWDNDAGSDSEPTPSSHERT
ncbi:hypothetical protein AAFF_G00285700 [Aldrovandia affinis]|uniref:C2H2-type domain-containing protein n=1 Tax=Aldrovandia affinis TaxID=143900 RepID=A0AAD7X230_9TELE|nr:hypothetical protein AAFF_G00285700 [Aldrovandia affinis]